MNTTTNKSFIGLLLLPPWSQSNSMEIHRTRIGLKYNTSKSYWGPVNGLLFMAKLSLYPYKSKGASKQLETG